MDFASNRLKKNELDSMDKNQLVEHVLRQNAIASKLTERLARSRKEIESVRKENVASSNRADVAVFRLTKCERDLKAAQGRIRQMQSATRQRSLSSLWADPAVNLLFEALKRELNDSRQKVRDGNDELNALKFTPDSQTGKRLMAKCRLLLQENEELGKAIKSGRIAKLENEIALQKNFVAKVKAEQTEYDELINELEEENVTMHETLAKLQKQLKTERSLIKKYQQRFGEIDRAEKSGDLEPNHSSKRKSEQKKQDQSETSPAKKTK